MDASETRAVAPSVLTNRNPDAPTAFDLDKCVHCGLCLNACPTYRELGVEMDSPRGRVYQMVQVATGQMEMGAVVSRTSRSLPRLPRMRDGLSVGCALRPND